MIITSYKIKTTAIQLSFMQNQCHSSVRSSYCGVVVVIQVTHLPRLFLQAPNPSTQCLTANFLAEKHCCKLFNVPQLGFCCIFKKQTNPYRGPQVESGIQSSCFSKRCTGLRTIHLTTWIKTMTMMKKHPRRSSCWFEELTCFAKSKSKAGAKAGCRPLADPVMQLPPSKMQLSTLYFSQNCISPPADVTE